MANVHRATSRDQRRESGVRREIAGVASTTRIDTVPQSRACALAPGAVPR